MSGNKKEYDLICSLGGNCSAAQNLRRRGLRPFSLPFDWLYILDETPITNLIDAFNNDFKSFCLKENLIPLPEGENKAHLDKIQYYDTISGYRFVNHFDKTIEEGGYDEVKEKLNRRILRLYEAINNGSKFLFILSTSFEFDYSCIYDLKNCLESKWPSKIFDFEIISFNCKQDLLEEKNNISIRKNKRDLNLYDFTETNFEWSFLDDICLNKKIVSIYPKKLFSISFGKYRLKLLFENKSKN